MAKKQILAVRHAVTTMGGSDEPATKDDVMNLEDKLDELMAEFEGLMGGRHG
jgi:hypothetical protein